MSPIDSGVIRGAVRVRTDAPVATTSLDHTDPRGTAQDNSRNHRFNRKLYELFRGLNRPVRVLDLGCAGGAFVRDCLYDGHFAVGLEGSDYSAVTGRAEWPVLGDRYLFTADITKPFDVQSNGSASRLLFDVITLWEVLEHIGESDLPGVFANIRSHLHPGGLVMASISDESLPHHQTCHARPWWMAAFEAQGLKPVDPYISYFATQFIRGSKYGAVGSFHVIATNDATSAPGIPPTRLLPRLLDHVWFGSPGQRTLRTLLGVE